MPPTRRHQITLGDGTRKWFLRYTTRAVGRMEEELGEPLQLTMARAGQMSMRALSGMIWAGLLHDDKGRDLSREQVLDMMKLWRLRDYLTVTTRAIVADTGLEDQLPDSMKADLYDDEEDGDSGKEDAATEDEEKVEKDEGPEPGP